MGRRTRIYIYDGLYYLSILVLSGFTCFIIYSMLQYSTRYYSTYHLDLEGKLYAVNKGSKSISVFDLSSGDLIQTIALKNESHEISKFNNSQLLAVPNFGNEISVGNTVQIIEGKTNKIIRCITLPINCKPHGVFDDGEMLYFTSESSKNLYAYNYITTEIHELNNLGSSSHLVIGDGKNSLFTYGSGENEVNVLNINNQSKSYSIPSSYGISSLCYRAPNELWISNFQNNHIDIYNLKLQLFTHRLKEVKTPIRMIHDKKQDLIWVANSIDGSVSAFHGNSKKLKMETEIPGKNGWYEKLLYHTPRIVQLKLHRNNSHLFLSNSNAGKIEVLDTKSFKLVASIKVGEIPDGIEILYD